MVSMTKIHLGIPHPSHASFMASLLIVNIPVYVVRYTDFNVPNNFLYCDDR